MGEMETAMMAALRAVNGASPFNRLAGFRVLAAEAGAVTLAIGETGALGEIKAALGETKAGAAELMNHAGALHAGVQSALIDTACGFAAGTVAGTVVTLQMNLQYLSSAKGERFEARGRVTKAGRNQIFAEAQLFALRGQEAGGEEVLVASGTAVLAKVG
jgi:uncharacterized protein (TIGR00369 family)